MTEIARFTMYRGDSKILNITVTDGDGVAVDIDDAERVIFAVFGRDEDTPVLTKALGDGVTVAGNIITVTLDAADTDTLLGNYTFEVEIVDGDGLTSTVIQGTAVFSADLITPESVP